MLEDDCVRVQEKAANPIHLSESAVAQQQFVALVETHSQTPQQRELSFHMAQAKRFSFGADKNSIGQERHHLIQVVGNPNASEAEWLIACELLGDCLYPPRVNKRPDKITVFAAVTWIASMAFMTANYLTQSLCTSTPIITRPIVAAPFSPAPLAPSVVPSDGFGPYMADLQRRVKRAWFPPKRNVSSQVKVIFSVDPQGRLSNLRMHGPCEDEATNRAALTAVRNAAPFRPLPPAADNDSVDIEFTFTYNCAKSLLRK